MAEIVKKSKDYGNGKIYMIRCNKTQLIYIGSTAKQYLSERMGTHKAHYRDWTNGKTTYCGSYEIIKNGDYVILLIESYPCKSNDELRMREQYHIDLNVGCMNKYRAHSTIEQNKERKKEYREAHKEQIKEQDKEYREAHKEQIKEYREAHKEQQKEYYEAHKETMTERGKEYYETNKEALLEQMKVKITCSCGAVISKSSKFLHERTKKHISRIPCLSLSVLSYPIF